MEVEFSIYQILEKQNSHFVLKASGDVIWGTCLRVVTGSYEHQGQQKKKKKSRYEKHVYHTLKAPQRE